MADNPDWPRVKELFHGALEREPAERAAFLHRSCGGEAGVRAQVERLLDAHEHADGFIEQSPVGMAGRVVGHYKIDRLIGSGGMGEVYRARDLELGRTVAVKIALGIDADTHARLRREAQHASHLNHPHICTIHEVGTFDGHPFIVMELVEGQRLSDLTLPDGLPADLVRRYGTQIADALAHAHRQGVTHRDLKAANIVVTPEGRAKVLDFGLARRISQESFSELSQSRESITAEGMVGGTLPYMAPELFRGTPADVRSDVWALGVLLYEMATGKRPFAGATGFELSAAILHEPPSPLADSIPRSLRTVIMRCLEKDPAARQSADEIRLALDAPAAAIAPSVASPVRVSGAKPSFLSRCWQHRVVWLLAIVLAYGSFRLLRRDGAPVAVGPSGRPAIAILHFENGGDVDAEWLSQGIPNMLLTSLAQTRGLDIVSMQRIREAAKQRGVQDLASLDPSQGADIAKQAGAGAIVTGSIYKAGAEIRIDARVEDLASGRVLAGETVRGSDVFAMVDQLTASIRRGVGIAQSESVRGVADVSTTSLEAYRAYAQGLAARTSYRFDDARTSFERAVSIDPRFAEAHLELAIVTSALGREDLRLAHLGKATEHRDRLSERERLMLRIESARARQEFGEAGRALDELIAKFPDVDDAYDIAVQLYHPVFGQLPSAEKALAFGSAGVMALPLSTVTHQSYAMALIAAGRNVDALREWETFARIAPREPEPHASMAIVYQVMGLLDKAVDAYRAALKIQPNYTSARLGLAWTWAMMGRYDEALAEVPPGQVARAQYLSRVGRYREAADELDAVTKAQLAGDQLPQPTHIIAALLAIERKAYAKAIAECDAADEFRDRLPARWRPSSLLFVTVVRGVAEARNGRIPQAMAQLDIARRTYQPTVPSHNHYRVLEGEIALARGELDRSAEAFAAAEPPTRAFQFTPGFGNNPPFRDGLARVAAARHDWKGAIEIYRRLLTNGPDQKFLANFEPLYVLEIARLFDRIGDKPEALKEYERFLDLWKQADPGLPELDEARRATVRLKTTMAYRP